MVRSNQLYKNNDFEFDKELVVLYKMGLNPDEISYLKHLKDKETAREKWQS